MKFILGKKLDMTQVWQGDKVMAVTRVQAGPCTIVQVKTDEKDGYSAVQVGYGERKEKNIAKPQLGHLKKTQKPSFAKATAGKHENTKTNLRYLREFRSFAKATEGKSGLENLKCGDVVDVNTFEAGDKIQVESVSKGKGFQGVVKRHGFHGQDKTHGTKDQVRMPGSIGATGPAHVFKGQKMPGRMGGDQVTVKGLEVVEVDKENNILLIKGAVPGARNGLVLIQGEGELKVVTPDTPNNANLRQDEESTETRKSSFAKATEDRHENKETMKHENKTVETPASTARLDSARLAKRGEQDVASEKDEDIEKVESKKTEEAEKETTEKNKTEDKIKIPEEVEKDEDIEKVVVEAAEKVEDKKKNEGKK